MTENLEQKSKGEHPFGKGMITGAIIAAVPIFMAGYAIGTARAINNTMEEIQDYLISRRDDGINIYSLKEKNSDGLIARTFIHNGINYKDQYSRERNGKKNFYVDYECDGKVDYLITESDEVYGDRTPKTENLFEQADKELADVKLALGLK